MLRVEEVTDVRALSEHEAEWSTLAAEGIGADFFQTPEWVMAWLGCFWQDKPIAFLFVRDGQSLVGLAPLLRDDAGALSCSSSLAFPVNPHAKRADFLHTVDRRALLETVFEYLLQTRGSIRLALSHERTKAEDLATMQLAAQDQRLAVLVRDDGASPIIRVSGDWDDYLRSRSSHFRREQARKCKKLEGAWNVRWTTARTAKEWERAMTDVLVIERNSWKDRAGTSFLTEDGVASFYSNLARRCASRQWLRLHLLYLDDRPVAHIYGLVYKGEFYAVKTTYDEAYRSWSPGLVLFQYVIRQALQDGVSVFDLLGEESRWKREIANDSRQYAHLCVYSTMQGRCDWCALRENTLKPFLRTNAPQAVELVKKARRNLPILSRIAS